MVRGTDVVSGAVSRRMKPSALEGVSNQILSGLLDEDRSMSLVLRTKSDSSSEIQRSSKERLRNLRNCSEVRDCRHWIGSSVTHSKRGSTGRLCRGDACHEIRYAAIRRMSHDV